MLKMWKTETYIGKASEESSSGQQEMAAGGNLRGGSDSREIGG